MCPYTVYSTTDVSGVNASCLKSSDYVDFNTCWNSVLDVFSISVNMSLFAFLCVVWATWTLFICAIRCA